MSPADTGTTTLEFHDQCGREALRLGRMLEQLRYQAPDHQDIRQRDERDVQRCFHDPLA